MIVTVFRSRLRPEAVEEYTRWATRMSALAQAMPGYVSHKVFIAEDGERVTVVEFESEATHRAWAAHPEHVQAQRKGRAEFYSSYQLQVCQVLRSSAMPPADA
jgi:heme-degrading monooxygenase HmoA